MRGPTLAILLAALAACTIDNPAFSLGPDRPVSDGSAATSGDGPTGPSTGSTSEATGSNVTTGGPDSGSSESGTAPTTSDTMEPLPVCAPTIDGALDPHLYVNGFLDTDCQNQTTRTVLGKLDAYDGALTMEINEICGPGDEGTALTLGQGYPLPNKYSGCVKATITWNKANGDCTIGLLDIRDTMTEKIYYLGAFDNYPAHSLPLQATPAQKTSCGCPGAIPGCCAPLDAGDLTLSPAGGGPIAPQQNGLVALDDINVFQFYNLESYVDAMCKWHIAWIADRQ